MAGRTIAEIAKAAGVCAQEHGWRDRERKLPEIIALSHSELSEALNEYAHERSVLYYSSPKGEVSPIKTWDCSKPEGIGIELADCIIRILEACDALGIDIAQMIDIKMYYNETRPYRHGGKLI
jgi:hypothetical protein